MVDYKIISGDGRVVQSQQDIKCCHRCEFCVDDGGYCHEMVCIIKFGGVLNCNVYDEIDKGCPLQPGYKLEL